MKLQLRSRRTPARVTRTAPRRVVAPETAEQNRQAVAHALGHAVQPKLVLGRTDDPQEAQADRVAAQVMGAATPERVAPSPERVQRECKECEEEEQRKKKPEDEAPVQRRATDAPSPTSATSAAAEGGALPSATATRIGRLRGAGAPLPAAEQSFFEPRLATPLHAVRVHADGESAGLSSALQARAFTVGHDIFFGAGEWKPGTTEGRHLLAHELTHVMQQADATPFGTETLAPVRRWRLGTAPAPAGLSVVTDAEQRRRLDQAEGIVRTVVASTRCRNYFTDNCTNGAGANALQQAFNNARIYLLPQDDTNYGLQPDPNQPDIAFNLRAFRIGRYMMASTLLHEMFHTCDPTTVGQAAEQLAEDSLERCRAYTPWIESVTPGRVAAGGQITVRGVGLGSTRNAGDEVRLNGRALAVTSWAFAGDGSSAVEIVATVPAGATSGTLVVVNNGVRSNTASLTVA